jgi:hypothetical protein
MRGFLYDEDSIFVDEQLGVREIKSETMTVFRMMFIGWMRRSFFMGISV